MLERNAYLQTFVYLHGWNWKDEWEEVKERTKHFDPSE